MRWYAFIIPGLEGENFLLFGHQTSYVCWPNTLAYLTSSSVNERYCLNNQVDSALKNTWICPLASICTETHIRVNLCTQMLLSTHKHIHMHSCMSRAGMLFGWSESKPSTHSGYAHFYGGHLGMKAVLALNERFFLFCLRRSALQDMYGQPSVGIGKEIYGNG